jgi:hypothetical protein
MRKSQDYVLPDELQYREDFDNAIGSAHPKRLWLVFTGRKDQWEYLHRDESQILLNRLPAIGCLGEFTLNRTNEVVYEFDCMRVGDSSAPLDPGAACGLRVRHAPPQAWNVTSGAASAKARDGYSLVVKWPRFFHACTLRRTNGFNLSGYPTNRDLADSCVKANSDLELSNFYDAISQHLMAQANYQTVFHIGLGSFPWSFMLVPALMIAVGCALIRFQSGKQIRQVVGWVVISVSLLSIFLVSLSLIPEFLEVRHAYLTGDSSIIEGTVENFHPMPSLGPAKESFSVRDVAFSYYVGELTPCFHNDPPRRGPIHAGLNVRIYYKDWCIQRVDIHR